MHAAYTTALILVLSAAGCSATHAHAPAQEAACCGGGTNAIRARACVAGGGVLLSCPHGKYAVNGADAAVHVADDGTLHVGEGRNSFDIEPGQYCTTRFLSNATDTTGTQGALICFEDQTSGAEYELSGALAIVSVFFLLLTLAVYAVLPQLRDLQGKCIMCMCGSMAIGFLNLGVVQLGPTQHYAACAVHGFMTYFWMLATFFWMNVVSINVWMSVAKRNKKISEDRQFVVYSLYAWGSSAVMLIATLLTNYVEGDHIKPGIGESSCWFKGSLETWVYFYGPVAILIASNILLFIVTSIQLWRKTNSLHVSNLQILKFRFRLYFKLFLITGISWIFEITSFAHGQRMWLWVITDVINCLQGLIIFLLLVAFRKRALRGLATAGYLRCLAGPVLRSCAAGEDQECEEMVNEEELEQTTPAA